MVGRVVVHLCDHNYYDNPSIKQLFNTYPKRGSDKKIFENDNTHILNELGYEFISKKKKMKDTATNKAKVVNVYSIGKCKILIIPNPNPNPNPRRKALY